MSDFISNCSTNVISSAALNLLDGRLVAFPTETVYGLGADANNFEAIARIYSTKSRPVDHPLIVHIASMNWLNDWATEVPDYAISLARDFWPGPMTLVVKRSNLASDFITGKQNTVGLRVPNHPIALELLEAFVLAGGKGIAAPSANRFGGVSPTTASAVKEELGDYLADGDQILDGGLCKVGVESTIIDCTGSFPKILRPGAITLQMIEESTGLDVSRDSRDKSEARESVIRVSGSLETHYAPAARVLLRDIPIKGQGYIAPSHVKTPEGVIRLAAPSSDEEFARILYSALREADLKGLAEVVVMQPMGSGIAIAIRDRLLRAAGRKIGN